MKTKTGQKGRPTPTLRCTLYHSTFYSVFPSVELKYTDIKCLLQAVNTSYPKAEMKFNKHYEVPLEA